MARSVTKRYGLCWESDEMIKTTEEYVALLQSLASMQLRERDYFIEREIPEELAGLVRVLFLRSPVLPEADTR